MEANKIEETFEERIERERREEREYQARVEALICEVSQILGFTPEKHEKDESWHHVSMNARKGNESLHFSSGGYLLKDRIKISGNFPRARKGEYFDPYVPGEKRHEITVSIRKTPEQIARDIERRFLPHYQELLKKVLERIARMDEYDGICARNLERVKGKKPTEEEKEKKRLWLEGPISCEVQVTDEDATIELRSVPIEVARKVLELVEKAEGKPGRGST